jgi:hypothetical protein
VPTHTPTPFAMRSRTSEVRPATNS